MPSLPLRIGSGPCVPSEAPEVPGTEAPNRLDVNLVDSNGKTALFLACEHRRAEFVKALVELGHPDCDLSPTGGAVLCYAPPSPGISLLGSSRNKLSTHYQYPINAIYDTFYHPPPNPPPNTPSKTHPITHPLTLPQKPTFEPTP